MAYIRSASQARPGVEGCTEISLQEATETITSRRKRPCPGADTPQEQDLAVDDETPADVRQDALPLTETCTSGQPQQRHKDILATLGKSCKRRTPKPNTHALGSGCIFHALQARVGKEETRALSTTVFWKPPHMDWMTNICMSREVIKVAGIVVSSPSCGHAARAARFIRALSLS